MPFRAQIWLRVSVVRLGITADVLMACRGRGGTFGGMVRHAHVSSSICMWWYWKQTGKIAS